MSAYGATNGVGVHATVTRKKEDTVTSKAEHEEAEALTLEDRVAILERQVANLTSDRAAASAASADVDASADVHASADVDASADVSADASADVSVDASMEVAEGEDSLDDSFEDTK